MVAVIERCPPAAFPPSHRCTRRSSASRSIATAGCTREVRRLTPGRLQARRARMSRQPQRSRSCRPFRRHRPRSGRASRPHAHPGRRALRLRRELRLTHLPPRREPRGAGNAAGVHGVRLLVPTRTHSLSRQRKHRYTLA